MDKEWRERNKDKLSEYFKQYNQTHKEKKKAYNHQKYTFQLWSSSIFQLQVRPHDIASNIKNGFSSKGWNK